MRGCSLRSCEGRAWDWVARHWVASSFVALLIVVSLVGFMILWTGVTWSHMSVIAQGVVATGALVGYIFSYQLYRGQEKHKYRAALVATFPVPAVAHVSVQRPEGVEGRSVRGWNPGFVLRMEGSEEVLDADFILVNVSESPVTDVRMNFYWHDCERLDERPKRPAVFFEDDISVVDGVGKGAEACVTQILRSHLISPRSQSADGGTLRAFDFSRLFLSLIPSEARDKPAQWSTWTLVLKYQNLQGEPFFSAYKSKGSLVPVGPLPQEEYFRMVFCGSFVGDYLKDDKHHKFVANRGFPNAKVAPDWRRIKAVVQEITASIAVASVDPGRSSSS